MKLLTLGQCLDILKPGQVMVKIQGMDSLEIKTENRKIKTLDKGNAAAYNDSGILCNYNTGNELKVIFTNNKNKDRFLIIDTETYEKIKAAN